MSQFATRPARQAFLTLHGWHQNGQEVVAKPRLHFAVALLVPSQKLRLPFSRSTRSTAVGLDLSSQGQTWTRHRGLRVKVALGILHHIVSLLTDRASRRQHLELTAFKSWVLEDISVVAQRLSKLQALSTMSLCRRDDQLFEHWLHVLYVLVKSSLHDLGNNLQLLCGERHRVDRHVQAASKAAPLPWKMRMRAKSFSWATYNSARMTSEKDCNKHKTEKQLSQLKDRLDKEGVETHGTSARLLPVLPRWAVHPVQAS